MSQRDDLKDMLFEQLADLEIFERLLRFDPARQKLFLCLATLISRGKPLASQLKQTYTGRYKQQSKPADNDAGKAQTTNTTATTSTSSTTKTASKLAKLAKAKLDLNCKSHNNKTSEQKTSTASSTSSSLTTTMSSSSQDAIIKSLDDSVLQGADTIQEDCEYPFGLEAIDFGLRLGSFLSEAGWLADSIEILTCVATKLKRMTLDKKLKIIYLDCLQR